jgi:hypothetical protein
MIYKFREGHSAPVPAQVVGERLAELEAADCLNPAALVDDARPEDSPLHPAFEWDDDEAAERYREDQARSLIRSVFVVPQDGVADTRQAVAFVSVGSPRTGARYVTTSRAMSDADMRASVLADALAAMNGLQVRYGHLNELAEVFTALAKVPAKVKKKVVAKKPQKVAALAKA